MSWLFFFLFLFAFSFLTTTVRIFSYLHARAFHIMQMYTYVCMYETIDPTFEDIFSNIRIGNFVFQSLFHLSLIINYILLPWKNSEGTILQFKQTLNDISAYTHTFTYTRTTFAKLLEINNFFHFSFFFLPLFFFFF